jgi:hypothetical protein
MGQIMKFLFLITTAIFKKEDGAAWHNFEIRPQKDNLSKAVIVN